MATASAPKKKPEQKPAKPNAVNSTEQGFRDLLYILIGIAAISAGTALLLWAIVALL